MEPTQPTEQEILDFGSFIKKFYPEYQTDNHNLEVIKLLNSWANRLSKFNNAGPGFHLDRGILIMGVPGVGKDVIMKLLKKYLSYLRSAYGFEHKVVWQYAKEFMKKDVGYACFDNDRKNIYYEELALSDEGSNPATCSREHVQHFGNKLLIGRELISVRYNHFINFGWQSHFSTNCTQAELKQIYGDRAVDRLKEMCNWISLEGNSKRGKNAPMIVSNTNIAAPPRARETTVDEHRENKAQLEAQYQGFLQSGNIGEMASITYQLLRSYGCDLGTDDEINDLMDEAAKTFCMPIGITMNKEQRKKEYIWAEAKRLAVLRFFETLKFHDAKSIFEEINVNVERSVNNIVSQNKGQQ